LGKAEPSRIRVPSAEKLVVDGGVRDTPAAPTITGVENNSGSRSHTQEFDIVHIDNAGNDKAQVAKNVYVDPLTGGSNDARPKVANNFHGMFRQLEQLHGVLQSGHRHSVEQENR